MKNLLIELIVNASNSDFSHEAIKLKVQFLEQSHASMNEATSYKNKNIL